MAKKDLNLSGLSDLITSVEEMDEVIDQEEKKSPGKAQEAPTTGKQKAKGNGGVVFSTRLDETVVRKLKGYAFYNEITLKEALETIITDYLDGKTISETKKSKGY